MIEILGKLASFYPTSPENGSADLRDDAVQGRRARPVCSAAWTPRTAGRDFSARLSERRCVSMATGGKSLTKSEIASHLAEKSGLSKKQVTLLLQSQAELAYKNAKNVFTIPGIGKLKLVDRPARKMIMRFGPDAGQEKLIPKSKKVRFTVAKAAKDAILGKK
jgi:DNA-binding protein HU-beta